MGKTFEEYLILIGRLSEGRSFSLNVIIGNIDYFKNCHSDNISVDEALNNFDSYLHGFYDYHKIMEEVYE